MTRKSLYGYDIHSRNGIHSVLHGMARLMDLGGTLRRYDSLSNIELLYKGYTSDASNEEHAQAVPSVWNEVGQYLYRAMAHYGQQAEKQVARDEKQHRHHAISHESPQR